MPTNNQSKNSRIRLSRRCEIIERSEIRNMSVECDRVGGINLSQGVCDMPVPEPVKKAAQKAIDDGLNTYTRHDGIAELRSAIASKMAAHNGIEADPETEIVVSAGATGAFYCACMALLDPGDEVLIFEPYYGYHVITLRAVEAVPVYVKLRPPDWIFDMAELEKAVTPRTKAIMINTPCNPSGKVFTEGELRSLAEFAVKHDLIVFTDEIYEYMLYDGRKHISPGSLPAIRNRTVTISGFSKMFSVTGWRLGYSVCRADWAKMIGYMNDMVYVCAPAPLQAGAAAGLVRLGKPFFKEMEEDLTLKRDLICSALTKAGLAPYEPQGAYYVLANVAGLPGKTSKDKAMGLLKSTGVACVPGEAFYDVPEDGDKIVRFCYAKPLESLREACRRLENLKMA